MGKMCNLAHTVVIMTYWDHFNEELLGVNRAFLITEHTVSSLYHLIVFSEQKRHVFLSKIGQLYNFHIFTSYIITWKENIINLGGKGKAFSEKSTKFGPF